MLLLFAWYMCTESQTVLVCSLMQPFCDLGPASSGCVEIPDRARSGGRVLRFYFTQIKGAVETRVAVSCALMNYASWLIVKYVLLSACTIRCSWGGAVVTGVAGRVWNMVVIWVNEAHSVTRLQWEGNA